MTFPRIIYILAVLCLCSSGAPGEAATAKAEDPCTPIREVIISGNHSFSDLRLKPRLKNWSASLMPGKSRCLNREWLKKDLRNLIRFYREKGFADVEISAATRALDDPPGDYELEFQVKEGLEYVLEITGADYFSPRSLKKEIDLVERGNPGDTGLKRGVRAIQARYVEAGFSKARAVFAKQQETRGGQQVWHVTIEIDEGPQQVVESVSLEGNSALENTEIQAVMQTAPKHFLHHGGFSRKTLDDDIRAIENLYRTRGFNSASVQAGITTRPGESDDGQPAPALVSIVLTISEGLISRVGVTKISGLDTILDRDETLKLLTLKPGEPFRDYMIKSDANLIASLISEKGYPHVIVNGSSTLDPETRTETVTWTVNPGPLTRIGTITVSGNERLKQDIIDTLLTIKTGDLFSLKEILAAEKRLRTIQAIKSARITAPELGSRPARADLSVMIEEAKPYFVESAIGYDTEQMFYITSRVGDTNFLGRDIDASMGGELSGVGYQGTLELKDPFFLNTDMTASTTLFVEEKEDLNLDFGVKAWGISTSLSKPLLPTLTAAVSLGYENRMRFGDEDQYASLEDADAEFETRNSMITSATLTYDTRDSVIRPRKGLYSFLSTEVYAGFDSDLDRFVRFSADLRAYYSPFKRVTLAARTKAGRIEPFASADAIAEDRLFFLGGTSDVRGFDENMLAYDASGDPAGGLTMFQASVETRIELMQYLELTLFIDSGRLDTREPDLPGNDFRWSTGAGISYISPIGPVSLLYGRKLNREPGESPGRFHFSIGYTF